MHRPGPSSTNARIVAGSSMPGSVERDRFMVGSNLPGQAPQTTDQRGLTTFAVRMKLRVSAYERMPS